MVGKSRTRWIWPVAVVIVILASAALSLLLGSGQSLWFDEQYSVLISGESMGRLIELTSVDVHPPLYYLLLKVWGTLFSWNDTALRALSCGFCGLSVGCLALIADRLFGRATALRMLPLLVLAPFALRYGYEIRMYSLAMLFVTFGTYALLRTTRYGEMSRSGRDGGRTEDGDTGKRPNATSSTRGWWLAYAVTVALGMYTLYLTILVWATHAVWLVIRSWRTRAGGRGWSEVRHADWRWIGVYLLSIVLYLPWMPALLAQVANPALPTVTKRLNMSMLASTYTAMMVDAEESDLPAVVSLVLLVLLVVLIVLAVRLCQGRLDAVRRTGLLLAGSLFAVPMMAMMLISALRELLSNGFFMQRYASVYAPFFYLTVAAIVVLSAERRQEPQPTAAVPTIGTVDAAGTCAPVSPDGAVSPSALDGTCTPSALDNAHSVTLIADVYTDGPTAVQAQARRDRIWLTVGRITAVAVAIILAAGVVVVRIRGNYGFERGSTPQAAALSEQVRCDATHPVVAANEYTYIDAYYYYRDCSSYRFYEPEDVSTTGGYAPLHDSPAQLRDFDDLEADSFTLLTQSSHEPPDVGDRYELADTITIGPNTAIVYQRADD